MPHINKVRSFNSSAESSHVGRDQKTTRSKNKSRRLQGILYQIQKQNQNQNQNSKFKIKSKRLRKSKDEKLASTPISTQGRNQRLGFRKSDEEINSASVSEPGSKIRFSVPSPTMNSLTSTSALPSKLIFHSSPIKTSSSNRKYKYKYNRIIRILKLQDRKLDALQNLQQQQIENDCKMRKQLRKQHRDLRLVKRSSQAHGLQLENLLKKFRSLKKRIKGESHHQRRSQRNSNDQGLQGQIDSGSSIKSKSRPESLKKVQLKSRVASAIPSSFSSVKHSQIQELQGAPLSNPRNALVQEVSIISDSSSKPSKSKSSKMERKARLPLHSFRPTLDIFRVGNSTGKLQSISYLKEGGWIDDDIIHAIAQHFITAAGNKNVYLIDSIFADKTSMFCKHVLQTYDRDASSFFIFLNPGKVHWILAKITLASNTIITYDSLPSITAPYYDKLMDKLIRHLRSVGIGSSKTWIVEKFPRCSIQQNDADCGPMSLLFLHSILHNLPMDRISLAEVSKFRLDCAKKLLRTTDHGRQLMSLFNGKVKSVIDFCARVVSAE